MANIKNLASSFVASVTNSTTIVVTAGTGTFFPAAPFYATLTSPASLSNPATAEIVLVTAVSTDTFTITRAQKGTATQTIAAGWIISNGIYAEDLFNSSIQMDQSFVETPNGTNKVFTTAQAFTSIQIYKNATTLAAVNDFTITGTNQVTFVTAPATGTTLRYTSIQGNLVANSNADMVDGFNASSTPTPNTLLPLDSNGSLPDSILQDTGWITPTFSNSWSSANGTTVSYRRIGGVIYFRGQIGKTTLDATTMFTLPSNYRPSFLRIYTVPGSSTNYGKIVVNPDGTVNLGTIPSGGAYVGIDAVSYPNL